MSESELKEISCLIEELRKARENDPFCSLSDFDILKILVECAIIKSLDITVEEYYKRKEKKGA